jgi:hypothetical protein
MDFWTGEKIGNYIKKREEAFRTIYNDIKNELLNSTSALSRQIGVRLIEKSLSSEKAIIETIQNYTNKYIQNKYPHEFKIIKDRSKDLYCELKKEKIYNKFQKNFSHEKRQLELIETKIKKELGGKTLTNFLLSNEEVQKDIFEIHVHSPNEKVKFNDLVETLKYHINKKIENINKIENIEYKKLNEKMKTKLLTTDQVMTIVASEKYREFLFTITKKINSDKRKERYQINSSRKKIVKEKNLKNRINTIPKKKKSKVNFNKKVTVRLM